MLVPALAAEGEGEDTPLFSYNGVNFPELPEHDETKYPYAFIVSSDGSYCLNFVSSPPCSYSGSFKPSGSFILWIYDIENQSWVFSADGSGGKFYPFSALIWSSSDVLDVDDGSLVFAGSDPVPIVDTAPLMDETGSLFSSVIGWVGDVAGTIVDNPILLLFCIAVPLCGIGVGFFRRLLSSRG